MQKTTRLVTLSRKALLGILLMACLATAWPSSSAHAQDQPADDTWGEKTPPKNYVRSKAPNTGDGAYKWKQMAAASGVMAIMGLFVFVLIRRARREDNAA